MIKLDNVTLTYPSGKGIFDIRFEVKEGTVMGYLGPNGAGKTTTIRALLGFMKADSGSCFVRGNDCWTQSVNIQRLLGYIPGEISFPDGMNGDEFLDFLSEMRGSKDLSKRKDLLDMLELDPKGRIRKFSKGMKQKLGIVAALMHDPDILVLDEPTSGLDPLMQKRFVELILDEKRKGKTILLSSHIFEEVEKTCDEVIIIKDGRIVMFSDSASLRNSRRKAYQIRTGNNSEAVSLLVSAGFEIEGGRNDAEKGVITVYVKGEDVDRFVKTIASFEVVDIDLKTQSLEDVFLSLYARDAERVVK